MVLFEYDNIFPPNFYAHCINGQQFVKKAESSNKKQCETTSNELEEFNKKFDKFFEPIIKSKEQSIQKQSSENEEFERLILILEATVNAPDFSANVYLVLQAKALKSKIEKYFADCLQKKEVFFDVKLIGRFNSACIKFKNL